MRRSTMLLVSVLVSACDTPSRNAPPVTPADVALAPPVEAAQAVEFVPPKEASRVVVLQTTKLDRYAEVLGPVDVHESMGSEAAALERLREKAAAMGADAIVGVEFHHGEAEGEPTHLSGLAVRFVGPVSFPMP